MNMKTRGSQIKQVRILRMRKRFFMFYGSLGFKWVRLFYQNGVCAAMTCNEVFCKQDFESMQEDRGAEGMDGYHNLLPTYLQDVLRRSVNRDGGEERFTNVAYVGQLDGVIRRVREGFPQAFKG